MHQDHKLFSLILKGDTHTISRLYDECLPKISTLILKNSGHLEDAEDVFQEALVIVYRKLKANTLTLSCSLGTYIYSVCRNIWLDRLRKSGREVGIIEINNEVVDIGSDVIETLHLNNRYSLYQKHFSLLSEGCQKLMKLFLENVGMKKITIIMGYGSEQYTRKRKFHCKEKLIKSIKADKLFSELR